MGKGRLSQRLEPETASGEVKRRRIFVHPPAPHHSALLSTGIETYPSSNTNPVLHRPESPFLEHQKAFEKMHYHAIPLSALASLVIVAFGAPAQVDVSPEHRHFAYQELT